MLLHVTVAVDAAERAQQPLPYEGHTIVPPSTETHYLPWKFHFDVDLRGGGGIDPKHRTLKGNLARQKEAIRWDSLPKTFQDAALVTCRLGIVDDHYRPTAVSRGVRSIHK